MLLTRDEFRFRVFSRDSYRCVICSEMAQDAHHIMERRVWPDGGYYLDNGASVCARCHLLAESTELACEALRTAAKIGTVLLPPHLYPDQRYDKWGNEILPNGQRLMGELFGDESVQKILKPVLHLFTCRVKYPRTYHLPWSPGVGKDDRKWSDDTLQFYNDTKPEVVVTMKMDGENTSMYTDGLHARSLDYDPHESRNYIKALHAKIAHDIPQGWRLCGENLYAKHSILYTNLPGYFLVFGIWNQANLCLSWQQTTEWAELLGFPTVPVIYKGPWSENLIRSIKIDTEAHEGYVVRPTAPFHFRNFRKVVGKWVRPQHVQTHGGWKRHKVTPNILQTV